MEGLLTCGICAQLFRRPFATVPCGHIACYDCLKQWFQHLPNPVHSQNDEIEEIIPLVRRKKSCPSCRSVLISRPVELFALKAVVDLLEPNRSDSNTRSFDDHGDLWEGIFHPDLKAHLTDAGGIIDYEDGGISRCPNCLHEIWDGICSGCNENFGDNLAPDPWERTDNHGTVASDDGSEHSAQSNDDYGGSFIDDEELDDNAKDDALDSDSVPGSNSDKGSNATEMTSGQPRAKRNRPMLPDSSGEE